MNYLLKEERVLTDEEKGTTTDYISTEMKFKGKRVNLIDLPGLENMKFNKKKFSL